VDRRLYAPLRLHGTGTRAPWWRYRGSLGAGEEAQNGGTRGRQRACARKKPLPWQFQTSIIKVRSSYGTLPSEAIPLQTSRRSHKAFLNTGLQ
jgi:hypothetical protein